MVHNNHNIFKDISFVKGSVARISTVHILLGLNAAFIRFIRMLSYFLNPLLKMVFGSQYTHSIVWLDMCKYECRYVCLCVGTCMCAWVSVCKLVCICVEVCRYINGGVGI